MLAKEGPDDDLQTLRYRSDSAIAPIVPDSGRRNNVSRRLQLQLSNHCGALLLVNNPSVSTALMRLTEVMEEKRRKKESFIQAAIVMGSFAMSQAVKHVALVRRSPIGN
jgi:hypothetical protein